MEEGRAAVDVRLADPEAVTGLVVDRVDGLDSFDVIRLRERNNCRYAMQ